MRRIARESALQILFQTEFTAPITLNDFKELVEHKLDKDTIDYTELLVRGVEANKDKIDALIQSAGSHWSIGRMAVVDRNILRVAIFEMKFSSENIPPSVAINEAVDIAKKFGNTESGAFINGLLDSIAKGL